MGCVGTHRRPSGYGGRARFSRYRVVLVARGCPSAGCVASWGTHLLLGLRAEFCWGVCPVCPRSVARGPWVTFGRCLWGRTGGWCWSCFLGTLIAKSRLVSPLFVALRLDPGGWFLGVPVCHCSFVANGSVGPHCRPSGDDGQARPSVTTRWNRHTTGRRWR